MSEIENQISFWSSSLSERLLEIRFIDIDEMKAAMSVHLKSALYDCLNIQTSDIEKKLIDAKKRYVSSGGGKNNHIQGEIIQLRAKLKEQNKLGDTLEKFERIKQQNKWMIERHPDSFKEFNKYWEENFEYRNLKNK